MYHLNRDISSSIYISEYRTLHVSKSSNHDRSRIVSNHKTQIEILLTSFFTPVDVPTLSTEIDKKNVDEYNAKSANMIARMITEINANVSRKGIQFVRRFGENYEKQFSQQYIVEKGLKKFGERGKQAAEKELDHLHQRGCFRPIDISSKTLEEKKRTQKRMMLLTEKNNDEKTVKGRLVYDGSKTRDWVSREEAASPTVFMESISLTTVIDAKENRDVMTADIPNAFIQAHMPKLENGENRVIMKITGVLVDLLVKLAPDIYTSYVVFENGKKVLYVEVLRALYGMLVATLLWYKR